MAIIQAIVGSSFPFNSSAAITLDGGITSVTNIQPGLIKRFYNGLYFNDDPALLDGTSPTTTEPDTNPIIFNIGDLYSVQWTGYFYASLAGNYTFKTASDDSSFVWLGNNAVSGFTTSNVSINNGGTHGTQDAFSPTYALEAGTYYPIRIMFGEAGGGDVFNMSVDYNGYGYGYISGAWIWYCGNTSYGFNTL